MTGAALVVGAIMLVGVLLKLRDEDSPPVVRNKLAHERLRAVSDLDDGDHAAIRGVAAPIDGVLLTSPLGNKPCLYWRILVEEVGTGGDYALLGRYEEGTPFLVRTDSGPARVIPERPHVGLEHAEVFVRPQGAYVDAFGRLLAASKRPNHPGSTIRMKELRVVANQVVTICGYVAREQDPEAAEDVSGYRAQLPTRPVISGSRKARLLIAGD